jgi:hypothetical protein
MSNVLLIQSSISAEQPRSHCHLLSGLRFFGSDHRSPISRTAYAFALAASVVFLVAAFAPAKHAQRAVGPFAGLAGAWNGSGRVEMQSGTSERIRCRARYSVSQTGDMLVQDLRCASDSDSVDVNSTSQSDQGSLSGTWTELTRNVSGTLSGRASGGSIQARMTALGFSAGLTVNTAGNTQSVTIIPEGNEVRSVVVTMKRGDAPACPRTCDGWGAVRAQT